MRTGLRLAVGALALSGLVGCLQPPGIDGPDDPVERLLAGLETTALEAGCAESGLEVSYTVESHPMVARYEVRIGPEGLTALAVDLGAQGAGTATIPPEVVASCGPECVVELVVVDGAGWTSAPLLVQTVVVDADADGFVAMTCGGGDCDDGDAGVHPEAAEVCDGVDNNCSGLVDEADPALDPESASTWYADGDGDGYGDPDQAQLACDPPGEGWVDNGEDCDDADATVHPGAPEVCDGVDNNCSGLIDDADPAVDLSTATTWYADDDGDGYGDPSTGVDSCSPPALGWVTNGEDCDDTDPDVHPGAPEVCDGVDNNCSGLTDDADPAVDLSTATTWYADADGDGFGDPGTAVDSCSPPAVGWVMVGGDCNDADAAIHPDAVEVCDEADNNCSGLVDDADPALDLGTASAWYADGDGDGFGDPASLTLACVAPDDGQVWLDEGGDCDDTDPAVNPAATEVCDGVDNNCSGLKDDADPALDLDSATAWYVDADGDGFGDTDTETLSCLAPDDGATWVSTAGDCDDTDPQVNPAAPEVCNGIDDNCSGLTDDDDPDVDPDTFSEWFLDADGDGFGDPAIAVTACAPPEDEASWVDNDDDCDDTDPAVNPDAEEVCDGIDNDCSGEEDDMPPLLADKQLGVCEGALKECTGAGGWVEPDYLAWHSAYEPVEVTCDNLDNDCDGVVDTVFAEDPDSSTLWCWGEYDRRMPELLDEGPWKMVVGDNTYWGWEHDHACAIDEAGQLFCWGVNACGQLGDGTTAWRRTLAPVAGGGTWETVALGMGSSCGIQEDGSLWCWGCLWDPYDEDLEATLAPEQVSAGPWAKVALGVDHACAIREDDSTLWCWGENWGRQLGTPTDEAQPQPVQVGTSTWQEVSLGSGFTCALDTDSRIWCWGTNGAGQVGRPDGGGYPDPYEIEAPPGESWSALSVAGATSCALSSGGSVWCWGSSWEGQFGNGFWYDDHNPQQASGGPYTALHASANNICAQDEDGLLWCWAGWGGLRGDGSHIWSNGYPSKVLSDEVWSSVGLGETHGCAIADGDGSLWCWGQRSVYSRGSGPERLTWRGDFAVRSMSSGEAPTGSQNTCFVRDSDGSLWCFGGQERHSFGNGSGVDALYPVPVDVTGEFQMVSAGRNNACALDVDGYRWCWGNNQHRMMGDGTTTHRPLPQQDTSRAWRYIGLGSFHACAIAEEDDALWCWGHGSNGKLGLGSNLDRSVPTKLADEGVWATVSLSQHSTCGIRPNGDLLCWGTNSRGRVGDGSGSTQNRPVAVAEPGPWRQVEVGPLHTCALKTDDTLWCWGYGASGALGTGDTEDEHVPVQAPGTWASVAVGELFTCAVDLLGETWCWGAAGDGQLARDHDPGTDPPRHLTPQRIEGSGWTRVTAGNMRVCGVQPGYSMLECEAEDE